MFAPGDIISHQQMCSEENTMLQQGMNSRQDKPYRIILMSVRPNAPYADRLEDEGRTLIYEGHNQRRGPTCRFPERVDQPMTYSAGSLTENGKFFRAAKAHKEKGNAADLVRVYEKLKPGIWVYNGVFWLVDAWLEPSGPRKVFKFRLELAEHELGTQGPSTNIDIDHTRMIPSSVKREVWKRDDGRCRECGATDNLHFDHILPFSKGGTSLLAENIQLLCARHNLAKSDRIE